MATELCIIVPRCDEDNADARRCRNCGHTCAPLPNTMAWHGWRDPDIQSWPLCEDCAATHGLVEEPDG